MGSGSSLVDDVRESFAAQSVASLITDIFDLRTSRIGDFSIGPIQQDPVHQICGGSLPACKRAWLRQLLMWGLK